MKKTHRLAGNTATIAPRPQAAPKTGAGATILLVEDDEILRSLARRLLERQQFRIIEASSLKDARRQWQTSKAEVDLLLSDVILPDGSGRTLAKEMSLERPQLKIIYTSGYALDALPGEKDSALGGSFIQKPFRPNDLLGLIRKVLNKDSKDS